MKSMILASASVIALSAVGAFSPASANNTFIYGGGGTLASKIYRDVYNCYGSPLTLTNSVANPQNGGGTTNDNVSYPTAVPTPCAGGPVVPGIEFEYAPTGSGAGLSGFENPTTAADMLSLHVASTNPVTFESTDAGAVLPYPETDFAGSDAPLPSTTFFPLPAGYGTAVAEVPTAIVGVALPINIDTAGNGTGTVLTAQLTTTQVCDLFKGTITNWSKFTAKSKVFYDATNPANQVTKDSNGRFQPAVFLPGPNENVKIAVRADSSGTTFITTNFLQYTCKIAGLTASLSPTVWTELPAAVQAEMTQVSGSGGIAGYVSANPNTIGYVSSDFVAPQSATGPVPAYVSNKAAKENGSVIYTVPTSQGVVNSASTVKITLKNYSGTYTDTVNGIPEYNAQIAGKGEGALSSKAQDAYAIFGFTFTDAYSCQPNAAAQAGVSGLINWIYGAGNATVNSVYAEGAFGTIAPSTKKETVGYYVSHFVLPIITAGHC